MAHLSNYTSFLLFTTLFLALQISARDSQFFSKVSHFDNNNVKETELPNREAPEVNKVDQQPPFVPETENSYGLYGHDESNQAPSTTTTKNAASYTTPTSYHPYKTEFENNKYFNNDAYNNRYNGEKQGMSDTRFLEGGRYFHDIYAEEQHPTTNYEDSSKGVDTNYWYNNRGGNYNGHQNQEKFEDEHENFEP
ncbi:hypothetical protein ACSQ67_013023 [Phaseolus vulgaris]